MPHRLAKTFLPAILLFAAFFAGAALSGCASNRRPAPFIVTSAQAIVVNHNGTPLSGGIAAAATPVSFTDAWDIHVSWFAVEKLNPHNLPLLATQATLVTGKLSEQPVLAATSLTSNVRIGWTSQRNDDRAILAANPSRIYCLGEGRCALAAGMTAASRLVDTASAPDQTLGHPEPRYVEVALSRSAGSSGEQLQLALTVQDSPAAAKADSPAARGEQWPANVYQHETALLQHALLANQKNVLLIVPFSLVGPKNAAVAAFVTIDPPGKDAGYRAAVARAQADLQNKASAVANPLWSLGLVNGLKELDDPSRRRAALVYLADQGQARLCGDVAMLADDSLLQTIATSVKRDAPAAINAGDPRQYLWVLNRSAISAMQPLLAKATLPAELLAVLTEQFGEPGRHAAAVDEIMRDTASDAELRQKLISENFIYLEDSSPAARVRALAWLAAQNLAPKGFDPLASPKQRRQALDAALSASTGGGQ